MKRPELGKWIERHAEYDELIFWRLDCLVRHVFPDFSDLVAWTTENEISLISATEPLDFSGILGLQQATNMAFFAEMEANAIRDRVTQTHAHLRTKTVRWPGGPPPYGYRIVKNPDGPGFLLGKDPESSEVVLEIVRRVIAGEAVNAITADLNRRGVPSPRDRARELALERGKPGAKSPTGAPWLATTVRLILRSRALAGEVMHRKVVRKGTGKVRELRNPAAPVTGQDGMPLTRAEPLVTEAEWGQLQEALNQASRVRTKWDTPSLLLGVAQCAGCGSNLYFSGQRASNGTGYKYYRCRRSKLACDSRDHCPAPPIKVEILDDLAGRHFLAVCGPEQVCERTFVPGEDHTEQLERVRKALAGVRDDRDRGEYDYPGGEADFHGRVGILTGRIKELAALPQRAARWELTPTGRTFAQVWEASDIPARRSLMKDAGYGLRAVRDLNDRDRLTVLFRIDARLASRAAAAAEGRAPDVPLPERDYWPYHLRTGPDGRQYWRAVIGEGVRFGQSEEDGDAQMAEWMAFEGHELTGKSHLPA
jgi:site-specific DNA recombinase